MIRAETKCRLFMATYRGWLPVKTSLNKIVSSLCQGHMCICLIKKYAWNSNKCTKVIRTVLFITRLTEQFVFETMHTLSVILPALLSVFAGELRFTRTIFYYYTSRASFRILSFPTSRGFLHEIRHDTTCMWTFMFHSPSYFQDTMSQIYDVCSFIDGITLNGPEADCNSLSLGFKCWHIHFHFDASWQGQPLWSKVLGRRVTSRDKRSFTVKNPLSLYFLCSNSFLVYRSCLTVYWSGFKTCRSCTTHNDSR